MSTTTATTMFELIACAIEQRAPRAERIGVIDGDCAAELYSLSRHHDVAHVVGFALDRYSLIDRASEVYAKFQKQMMVAILRYERLQYEYEQICAAFGEAAIDFLPLKGAVLRHDYPEPWMRTSCDIDVLIRPSDLARAEQVLCERLGYRKALESAHDVSYFSPSEVNLELHFQLNEPDYRFFESLTVENVWASAMASEEKPHHFLMPDALFYFYHIAHTAKHFVYSGCGIRPMIDLWILEHAVAYDAEARRELLAREGLSAFAETARALSLVWLKGEAHNEQTAFAEDYILKGGVYGSMENFVTVQQTRNGGRVRYAMSRLFPKRDRMKAHYPCLQKHPYLLPVMHVRRWFGIVFGGRLRRSINELSANQSVDRKQAKQVEQMIDRLGVQAKPYEQRSRE